MSDKLIPLEAAERHSANVDGSERVYKFRPVVEAQRLEAPAIISPAMLQGVSIPPRKWLVPEWIPSGVVTGLYGDGGNGKTLLAQQLQTSAALGQPWLGLPVEAAASLGVYCEDSTDELHRRQADINAHYGIDFRDVESVQWMPRLGDDNLMIVFTSKGVGELTPFHRQVAEAARDLEAKLIVVDTVSDTFGGNENDRGQVRQYVSRALGSLARAIDGTVIACAHPSRSGLSTGEGDGGSTAWSNAFRSRLFLTIPTPAEGDAPDANGRILYRKKANYAARNDEIALRWNQGIIAPDKPPGSDFSKFGRRPADDVFLELLDATTAEGRPVSDSKRAPNYAPKLFAGRPDRDGYRLGDFLGAMERLFIRKAISMVEYGRRSSPSRKITRGSPHA